MFRIALVVVAVLTAATLAPAAVDPRGGAGPFLAVFFPAAVGWQDWQQWLLFAVYIPMLYAFLITVMLLSCVTLPFSIALAIIVYSQFFLGMAFGADTFFLAIATEISAEPNPPRPAPVSGTSIQLM